MQPVRRKILFVEDHDDTRDLFSLVLDQSNYEVVTSASMAAALTLAETGTFDLFVLDSLLEDGTGLELCKRIRQIDHSTPILFYSALAYEKDKNEAIRSGAQGYLIKPVDIPVLCDTVAEMLKVSDESNGRGNGHGRSRGAAK
jgi:DNA-binding response OmpR family regulator